MKQSLLFFMILFSMSFTVNAQCPYTGTTDFCPDLDASTLTVGVPAVICGTTWGTEHAQVDNMQANCTYLIEYCGATFNAEIGVYTDGGGSLVAYSADGCGDDPSFNFSPSADGSYEFQMDNEGVCNTVSQNNDLTITLVSCVPLNIEENSLINETKIYPNPNNGIFNLKYNGSKELNELIISDITGKNIQQLPLNNFNSEQEINVSNLSKGVYFITISTDDNKISKKIVVE